MDAVHARGDQHLIQQSFNTNRKPDVAMVEEHLRLKKQLIKRKRPCRRADEDYLQKTKRNGEQDLSKMEAEGCGHVQVWVDVMNIVKAPENRDSMVSEMPVVEREVHQQKAKHEFNWPRSWHLGTGRVRGSEFGVRSSGFGSRFVIKLETAWLNSPR
jgi:hypothetical protein